VFKRYPSTYRLMQGTIVVPFIATLKN